MRSTEQRLTEQADRHAPGSGAADLALIRRVQQGDRSAFDLLVVKYQHKIVKLIMRYVRDHSEALDVAQEAFLKAWVALPGLVAEATFRVWLFRIARNESATRARSPRSAAGHPLPEVEDARPGPVEAAEEREGAAALRQAVGKLPATYREAYLLWTHENLSYPDIAGVLDVTEETARWRVCEARRRLTRILEKFLKP